MRWPGRVGHQLGVPLSLGLLGSATCLSGCGSQAAATHPRTVAVRHRTIAINIRNYHFNQTSIVAVPGDTIVWTNHDADMHTVTADTGSPAVLDSGALKPGATYRISLKAAGIIRYHCAFHPFMMGIIRVLARPGA